MNKRPPTVAAYVRSLLAIILFFVLLLFVYTPVVLVLLLVSAGRLTNFIMEKLVPPYGSGRFQETSGHHRAVKKRPFPDGYGFGISNSAHLF